MRNFLKLLTFAVIFMAAALFVPGCNNPAGNPSGDLTEDLTEDPTEGPDNTALVDKLVEHFNSTTVNIDVNVLDYGWMQMDATLASALGLGTSNELIGLVEGIEFTGALSYTPATGDAAPYLTYKFGGKNPQTLDPVVFTSTDVERIVEALETSLGLYTNVSTPHNEYYQSLPPITNPDFIAGYAYLGSISGIVTEFPDAGNISFTFGIIKDPMADKTKPAVSGVTGILISESSTVTIDPDTTLITGTYDSASKTLTATVSAAGITGGGAGGVAATFVSTITGKITNNKDLGYTRPLSASGVINGADVVISVKLGTTYIQAAGLAGAINGVEPGGITISGTSVSGGFVTGLANIPGATAGVTAAYNPDDHVITFTISAPAGHEFDPAADYGAAGNALGGKIDITTDDGNYTGAASTPTAAINGNLVITAILKEVIINPDAFSIITEAIEAATDGDLTGEFNQFFQTEFSGALITALANISDVTGTVTVVPIINMNTFATEGLTFTIAPAAGYSFSTDPGSYDGAASALNAKIGTVSIPSFFGPPTLMRANGTQPALTGGNLVLTVSLVNQ